jgi:DNA repair exonuclease SbcCD nuclease subunit
MKILVTSDLHLSEKIWKHRPIFGDSFYAWKQIVQIAANEQVDLVILAGDVLDKQMNNAETISYLYKGLEFLTSSKIPIPLLFIQGQHDFQSKTPWINTGSFNTGLRQHLQGDDCFELVEPWVLAGTDFLQEEEFQAYLKSDSALQANILVCHQVWKDFMGDVGKPQACFDDVPSNIKLLITGDYHDTICRKHNDMIVLSPGSTHLRSLSEPQDKNVFIVTLTDDIKVDIVPLLSRRLYTINKFDTDVLVKIQQCLEGNEQYVTENDIPEEIRTPIIYCIHNKDQSDLVQMCNQAYQDKAHLFYKVIKDNGEEISVDEFSEYQKLTLQSCLDNFIDKNRDPEAYNLALAFLSSPEHELVLHNWINTQLEKTSNV